ncbi:hypothetical protein F5B20DRAFT_577028 [Whalleya microplaca]|nr:hypothetical protein F5B20DRAFT_577028 [Whalleya microplaca]
MAQHKTPSIVSAEERFQGKRAGCSGEYLCRFLNEKDPDAQRIVASAQLHEYHGGIFKCFRMDYNYWRTTHSQLPPGTEDSVIILENHPSDWDARELSSHLLRESIDLSEKPVLKLIPRPYTAQVSLEKFWQDQIDSDIRYPLTRHGILRVDKSSIVNWIMNVDEEPEDQQILMSAELVTVDDLEFEPEKPNAKRYLRVEDGKEFEEIVPPNIKSCLFRLTSAENWYMLHINQGNARNTEIAEYEKKIGKGPMAEHSPVPYPRPDKDWDPFGP